MDPDHALILGRCALFPAVLMLWGAALFRLRLMPGACPGRFEPALLVVLLIATTTIMTARIAQIGDGWSSLALPSDIRLALIETTPGRSALIQFLSGLVVLATWYARRAGIYLAALGAVLVAQVLSGHAAASPTWLGYARQGIDLLHLFASGAWLGALPFVLRLLPLLPAPEARKILIRYSGEGHLWVALVLLTGITNMMLTVGTFPLDWSVRYQFLLSVKIATVIGMMSLAIRNRYILVPRFSRDPLALNALDNATRFEMALGITVALLVAWFGMLDPLGGK